MNLGFCENLQHLIIWQEKEAKKKFKKKTVKEAHFPESTFLNLIDAYRGKKSRFFSK